MDISDITEACERYKIAVSDLNEAMNEMRSSAESLPAESINSVVENFQARHEILVSDLSVSKNIRSSLRLMTNKVRKLERDIRVATGSIRSMAFERMATDHQPMQPNARVSIGADATGERNMAAPQALVVFDLNNAPSEDADQEDNLAEPKEREANNVADSEELSTADPMSVIYID